jgi:hypothetical protein
VLDSAVLHARIIVHPANDSPSLIPRPIQQLTIFSRPRYIAEIRSALIFGCLSRACGWTPFTLGSTQLHFMLNIPKRSSEKPHVVPLYKRHPGDRFATCQGIGQNPPLEVLLHSLAVCGSETLPERARRKRIH